MMTIRHHVHGAEENCAIPVPQPRWTEALGAVIARFPIWTPVNLACNGEFVGADPPRPICHAGA